MSSSEPGWDLYRTFLAVLETGSLSGAGRLLGLTQPTVSRHVDQLEQGLGKTLFLRTQGGLSPTEPALAMRPFAEAMAAAGAALLRAAAEEEGRVSGAVRISASEVVGVERLPPVLAKIRRLHPLLVLELLVSNEVDDLLRRDADIAVRMTAPVQQALVARRVASAGLGLHARADYLARCGTPATLADLRRFDLIGYDRETPALRALLAGVPGLSRDAFALRADNQLAQLAAVRAGFGIGVCQMGIAERDPRLVRVLADAFALELPTWIVMHEDLRASPRCRAVFDALAGALARPDGETA